MPSNSQNPLVPEINRPEYFGNSDALISDLAWHSLEVQKLLPDKSVHSLVLEAAPGVRAKSSGNSVPVRSAEPAALEAAVLAKLQERLGRVLPPSAGAALLDNCRAVRPEKAEAYAATSAVWPGVFLQGMRGASNKSNPANYFQIIGTLYAWGAPTGSADAHRAAKRILRAVLREVAGDPVAGVATAIASGVGAWAEGKPGAVGALRDIESHRSNLLAWCDSVDADTQVAIPEPFANQQRTPFIWMHRALTNLSSDAWREALPSRRWADWLSCILRTGIGLGFLYEMRYFRQLGQALLSGKNWEEAQRALSYPMLPWFARGTATSERDVAGRIRQWVQGGDNVRRWLLSPRLSEELTSDGSAEATYQSVLRLIQGDERAQLEKALTAQSGGANVKETINYALQCRERFSAEADLYSLLMRRGRYQIVDPAEEWVVVVAAMCCEKPGQPTTLGALRSALATIGIETTRDVLVAELERAGLSRSAHDADDALEITPSF